MEPVENVENNWNAFFINIEKKRELKTIGTVRIANREKKNKFSHLIMTTKRANGISIEVVLKIEKFKNV